MDAEDTKERIRQLRQRVVSDPSSISLGQDFSALTEQRLKSVKSWKPVKQEEPSKAVKLDNLPSDNYVKTPQGIQEEFENRYQSNLKGERGSGLVTEKFNPDQTQLLKQIDLRMENNSKEFLRFFEDKIEKMKNGVVSQSTFDEYKEKLNQKLFDEIQAFEKSFANKINSLEEILSKQNASWTEHLASETLNLTKNVQNEIDNAFAQTSELQTILPNKLAEVENKIFAQFNEKVRLLESEIMTLKDFSTLRTETMGSELSAQINEIVEKAAFEAKRIDEENKVLQDTFDQRINSSLDTLQADMVENSSLMEGEVENLKQQILSKSELLEADLKSKINDLDQKIVSDVMAIKLPINDKLDSLAVDFINLKETSALRSEAISSNLGEKIENLNGDLGDLRDSFAIKSEAMLSEINFEIGDLKRMLDLIAENSQTADETTRSYVDEQVGALTALAKSTAVEKFESLKKEITNIKDLFALRSDSISSELGMRIDDLKVTTDLNNEKRIKESDLMRSALEGNIELTKSSIEKMLSQKILVIEGRLTDLKNTFDLDVKNIGSNVNNKIQELGDQINSNASQSKADAGILKSFVEEKVKSNKQSLENSINHELRNVEEKISALMTSFGTQIKDISVELGAELKILDNKLSSSFEENLEETQEFLKSLESNEGKIKSHVEKLEGQFGKLEKDVADNLSALRLALSDSERRALGVTKDKYRTLKSLVWEQLDKLRKKEEGFDKSLAEIKGNMVTSDSLDSQLSSKVRGVSESNKTLFRDEIKKIAASIKALQGRILSESELKELFQNHTLNVNIGRNKALLSKVKSDYESDKLYKKYLGKEKIAKGLALTLVTGCLIAFVKTLV